MNRNLFEVMQSLDKNFCIQEEFRKITISAVVTDSRRVKKGDLFIAIKGETVNGHDFINSVKEKGASVIVKEGNALNITKEDPVFVITVEDSKEALIKICALFYPDFPRHIVAVTGTDGKTSTAEYLRQLWAFQEIPCASIGTLGIQVAQTQWTPNFYFSPLTVPEGVMLYEILYGAAQANIKYLVLEATSHGLFQNRLGETPVSIGIFNNFSTDHMDYHKTLEHYWKAKLILFQKNVKKGGYALLHNSLPKLEDLKALCMQRNITAFVYGQDAELELPFSYRILERKLLGYDIEFSLLGEKKRVFVPFIAKFQIDNLLAALCVIVLQKGNLENIWKKFSMLKPVSGRMERIGATAGGEIFIDYSHTADALKHALQALREHVEGKLGVIFGCGGDRDSTKRKIMGQIAQQYADWIIVTDDNPRTEDAALIRKEIKKGCPYALEIGDRKQAILKGVEQMGKGDMLLIAGKGHEPYQIIGKTSYAFSDKAYIQSLLTERS